jgi:hypothetical protein
MAGWNSVGLDSPVAIYERQAHASFLEFGADWQAGVVDAFEHAEVTESGIASGSLGVELPDPAATWTYLVTDHSFQLKTPAFVRELRARWTDWRA